jgi:PAS domain S-box-containing protein
LQRRASQESRPPADFALAEHERLVAALKASRAGTWRWHIERDVVEWDDALCNVYGIPRERAPQTSAEFLAFVHPDDRATAWSNIKASIETGKDADYQFRAVVGDTVRWIYDRSAVVRDDKGKPVYMLGACLDVTDRRRIEEERDAALHRQTLLLKELSHRTKNHLSMVIALLRLKRARQTDPQAKLDFDRAIERINTIAFLHDQLYRKDELDRINLQGYLEEICSNLQQSLLGESRIAIVRDFQPCDVHVDQAVPIGLIVNEVVTNAAKYAFAPGQDGRIAVRFRRRGARGTLTISDNGQGMPPAAVQGVGTRLIRALAQQIGARLRLVGRRGLTYTLTFAIPELPRKEAPTSGE